MRDNAAVKDSGSRVAVRILLGTPVETAACQELPRSWNWKSAGAKSNERTQLPMILTISQIGKALLPVNLNDLWVGRWGWFAVV